MDFFSFEFCIFLPILFSIYWIVPTDHRNIVLCLGGFIFYSFAGYNYAITLLLYVIVSYFGGIYIFRQNNQYKKTNILKTFIFVLTIILLFFKYYSFTISLFQNNSFNVLNVIMPIGLSFYTFEIIGYLVDVYSEKVQPENNFITYAAYIMFFPQLLSGPIASAKVTLPQFKIDHKFNYDKIIYGLKRISYGFFLKYYLASVLGNFVDYIYSAESSRGGILLLSTMLYTLQIYYDFYGYSEMAIGLGKLFDIDLIENFNAPYLSQSIGIFWSRWHISLTNWLKEYIYIPLGGNKKGKFRTYINIFVTFLVSGMWHGSNITYIVWGMLHGIGQIIERCLFHNSKNESNGIVGIIRIVFVLLFVNFTWIFFRADSINDAFSIIFNCFSGVGHPRTYILKTIFEFKTYSDFYNVKKCMLFSIFIMIIDMFKLKGYDLALLSSKVRNPFRWIGYVLYIFMIMYYTASYTGSSFIYFKF